MADPPRAPENAALIKALRKYERDVRARDPQSNLLRTLRKALRSIAAYPLPITSGKEALALEGVGQFIARRIDVALQTGDAGASVGRQRKRARSGSESEAPAKAPAAEAPPEPPPQFRNLAVDGFDADVRGEVARRDAGEGAGAHPMAAALRRNQVELVLILDFREVNTRNDRDFFESQLLQRGVRVEKRPLPLGDFLWVVRCSGELDPDDPDGDGVVEFVLDVVVERKTLDDLARSIVDGRYTEQKYRLLKSRCRRPVYLVEGRQQSVSTAAVKNLPGALTETTVVDGILVVRTDSASESAAALARMHVELQGALAEARAAAQPPQWDDPRLPWPCRRYEEFRNAFRRGADRSLVAVFGRQLRRVQGMSASKAEAVLRVYDTPARLHAAYDGLSPEDGRKLLENLRATTGEARRLGQALSARVYEVFRGSYGV